MHSDRHTLVGAFSCVPPIVCCVTWLKADSSKLCFSLCTKRVRPTFGRFSSACSLSPWPLPQRKRLAARPTRDSIDTRQVDPAAPPLTESAQAWSPGKDLRQHFLLPSFLGRHICPAPEGPALLPSVLRWIHMAVLVAGVSPGDEPMRHPCDRPGDDHLCRFPRRCTASSLSHGHSGAAQLDAGEAGPALVCSVQKRFAPRHSFHITKAASNSCCDTGGGVNARLKTRAQPV
jgi:hypothetical protein